MKERNMGVKKQGRRDGRKSEVREEIKMTKGN